MFGVVDQLMLRPPAHVVQPSRLRRIYFQSHSQGKLQASPATAYAAVAALKEHVPALAEVAGFYRTTLSYGRGRDAQSVDVQLVSANYFHLLGVQPRLGRGFVAAEDVAPRGALVAVVSDGFSRRELGGGPDVVGRGSGRGSRRPSECW